MIFRAISREKSAPLDPLSLPLLRNGLVDSRNAPRATGNGKWRVVLCQSRPAAASPTRSDRRRIGDPLSPLLSATSLGDFTFTVTTLRSLNQQRGSRSQGMRAAWTGVDPSPATRSLLTIVSRETRISRLRGFLNTFRAGVSRPLRTRAHRSKIVPAFPRSRDVTLSALAFAWPSYSAGE